MPTICRVGEALYGPHWVRPLAVALGVSERTMRYWQAGERTPPAGIWADCVKLAEARVKALQDITHQIRLPTA